MHIQLRRSTTRRARLQRALARARLSILIPVLLAGLALGACRGNNAPALDTTSQGFASYVYPGGLFQLELPQDWVVNDLSDAATVHVEFSPPGSPQAELSVLVVSLGEETAGDDFADDYLDLFYSNAQTTFKEVSRDIQADGSLRVTGALETPGGTTQRNDFLQQSGSYFVALRTNLPDDPLGLRTLTTIVNSFELNPEVPWLRSSYGLASAIGQGAVDFASLNAWTDAAGTFKIAGQVYNNATSPLEFVRVTAVLYDENGTMLAEQGDFIAADVVEQGEFSPFEVVFLDGVPPGTARYELQANARYADFAAETFYGPVNFAVNDSADFDDNGFLVISGQVTNNGDERAGLVKIIVTVFDTEQRVIATDTTLVEAQSLAPGETSTFRVQFANLGGQADTYLSTAQASLVP